MLKLPYFVFSIFFIFCLTSHNRYEYDLFIEIEMSTT